MVHCGLKSTRLPKIRAICPNLGQRVFEVNVSKKNRQPKEEVDTLPKEVIGFAKRLSENIVLDGGDIIQENNKIFIGKGLRTEDSGYLWLKKEFPEKNIIQRSGLRIKKLHHVNVYYLYFNYK